MRTLITSALPGSGGVCWPADRSAEELLAKQPAQTGRFYWLKVAKTGLGTQQARTAIARSVACDPDLIGSAGNRDRRGRCVQWFSVPQEVVDHPGPLRRAGAHGKMQVLDLTSSHKPVTPETVEGLKWTCRIRGGNRDGGYNRAKAILDALRRTGCPNWQADDLASDDLARLGRLVLAGRPLPRQAAAHHINPERCRRAVQGQLFNRWLAARVADGLINRCVVGDRLRSRAGEELLVTDPVHAQKRLDSWEAVMLGPLFGAGLAPVAGEAAVREAAVLAAAELGDDQVASLTGQRRAARVQPGRSLIDVDGPDLMLICELPVDASIDAVLDEITKADPETALNRPTANAGFDAEDKAAREAASQDDAEE